MNSFTPQSPRSDGLEVVVIDNSRGAIFADGKLLFKGFPESIEYTPDTFMCADTENDDVSSFRIFECLEGTLIRVFFYNNQWYTATSRKLDAFVSKWASPKTTFGQSFAREIKRMYNSDGIHIDDDDKEFLNNFYNSYFSKNKLYIFILLPSFEERIVCDERPDKVIYICSEDPVTHRFNFDDDIILDNDKIFLKRKEITDLKTKKDVTNFVCNINYKNCQGVVLFKETPNDTMFPFIQEFLSIKVLSKDYVEKYKLRGNVSSLKFRYLELRCKAQNDIKNFLALYPEFHEIANIIEEMIYKICKRLHGIYMKIYIENDLSFKCSKEEQFALKAIHKQYTLTRQRTTPSRINDILTAGNPTRINRLIRELIYREKI